METPKRPPAIFATLRSGFDLVSLHPYLLLPSVTLDLFLWLGPRAQAISWLETWLQSMKQALQSLDMSAEMMDEMMRTWGELIPRLNFWAALRTFPVGVPGLMWARLPLDAPVQLPAYVLPGGVAIVELLLLASVLGWFFGAFYLWLCARAAQLTQKAFWDSLRESLVLMLVWQGGLVALLLGASFAVGVLMLISLGLAQAGTLFFVLAIFWLLPLAYFSPFGIFVHGQTAWGALRASWRFVRDGQPFVNFFFFHILLLSWLSVTIWNMPADDSWLLLVGIAGHAFVSAALTVAALRYYHDLYAWLAVLHQQEDGGSLDHQL